MEYRLTYTEYYDIIHYINRTLKNLNYERNKRSSALDLIQITLHQ